MTEVIVDCAEESRGNLLWIEQSSEKSSDHVTENLERKLVRLRLGLARLALVI